MKPLEPPNSHQVRAAQGWFELGNHLEAIEELNAIPTALRAHPDVLEVRLKIHAKEAEWEQCAHIAEALVVLAPDRPCGWIHRSYALHELNRTGAALKALLPAVSRFPRAAIIPYNLACYNCQMGDLGNARAWLKMAFCLEGAADLKQTALNNPDLEPLWAEIGKTLPTQPELAQILWGRLIPNRF
jgi:predicted Zn-dependent protease